MLIVGLTGGIGTGKSTVAHMFAALGVPVIDADVIAHELVAPGGDPLARITRVFGDEVLDEQGRLDRARMRSIVFKNEQSRLKLEAILHPLIYDEIQHRLKMLDAPYCIVCIPLLIRTDRIDLVDRILVTDASREHQIQRIMERNKYNIDEIEAIIDVQTDRGTHLMAADDVIENDADLTALKCRVEELHARYLEIADDQA